MPIIIGFNAKNRPSSISILFNPLGVNPTDRSIANSLLRSLILFDTVENALKKPIMPIINATAETPIATAF